MPKPFKGPLFYTEDDRENFRGRKKETEELLYLVKHNDFSVCYAESGEGKSSLINAGLIPRLREEGFLPIRIVFDKDDFKKDIKDGSIFDNIICKEVEKFEDAIKEENKEREDQLPKGAWWKLRTTELRTNSYEIVEPVLIFDQFEEVFTCGKDLNWTYYFFKWLEDLYRDESPDKEYKPKKFKVLLSLRSEYVCELDYWSMNQFFIPSLKNNRYCLKPLRKASAIEIVKLLNESESLPSGLSEEDIARYAKTERSGNWESVDDNKLPCVSALILSLILTALSEKDEVVEKKLNELYLNNGDKHEEFFDFLLDHVYEKALQKCGAESNPEIKRKLEELEDILIDDNEKRRRIPQNQLPTITEETLKTLKEERVINEIDDHYEISHDSLVKIIRKRKEQRQSEREKEMERREERREDLTSSLFLLIAFACIVWLLQTFFQDRGLYVNILDKTHTFKSVPIFVSLILVPFLIHATVKRLKDSLWSSMIGLAINTILISFFFHDQQILNNYQNFTINHLVLAVFTLGVPAVTLFYSFRSRLTNQTWWQELMALRQSIPLWIYLLAIVSYIFYLCVYNTTIGVPEPKDSFWGILVVPLLTHEVIRLVFRHKVEKKLFLIFCLLLSALAFNNGFKWFFESSPHCFAFPMEAIMVISLCIVFVVYWLYKGLRGWKRILAITMELLVIALVFISSLGFFPWAINRNIDNGFEIRKVSNWHDVTIQDNEGLFGLVAFNGEQLFTCNFDTIISNEYGIKYFQMQTNKLKWEDGEKSFTEGCWNYDEETGILTWNILYSPLVEKEVLAVYTDSTLEAYAAKVYRELRNANISVLQSGQMYPLDSIKSLQKLYELQKSEFNKAICKIYSCYDNIYEKLKAEEVTDFYKAFTRLFVICMIRDQITKGNIGNLLDLYNNFLPLYFIEHGNINYGSNQLFELKNGITRVSFNDKIRFKVEYKGLRENDINAWFNYLMMSLSSDIYINSMFIFQKYDELVKNIIQKNKKQMDSISDEMEKIVLKSEKISTASNLGELCNGLKTLLNMIKHAQSLKNENERLIEETKDNLSKFKMDKEEIREDFESLVNDVYSCLAPVIFNTDCIYKSSFEYINLNLYKIAVFRNYDISTKCINRLDSLEKKRHEKIDTIKKFFPLLDEQIRKFSKEF